MAHGVLMCRSDRHIGLQSLMVKWNGYRPLFGQANHPWLNVLRFVSLSFIPPANIAEFGSWLEMLNSLDAYDGMNKYPLWMCLFHLTFVV